VTRRRTRFETKRRTASRRPGHIPGRRFAFAALIAAAAMGFSAASAVADGNTVAVVTLFPATGPPQVSSVSTSTLTANGCPSPQAYQLATPTYNGVATSVTATPWTVDTVLSCGLNLNLPPSYWVEVEGGDKWLPSLAYPLAPNEFSQGLEPVVFFNGDQPGYYEASPTPGGAAAAQSNADFVASAGAGVPIDVTESGPPLSVSITNVPASGEQPAGTPLTISAAASAPAGSQADPSTFVYSWANSTGVTFPAGTSGQTVVVDFPSQQETAVINVQVTGAGTGGDATVSLTVGGPSSTSSGTPSPSNGATSQPSAPAVGPAKSTGAVAGANPGKSSASTPGSAHKRHRSRHPASSVAVPKAGTRPVQHGSTKTTTANTSTQTTTSAQTATGTHVAGAHSSPNRSGGSSSAGSASTTRKLAVGEPATTSRITRSPGRRSAHAPTSLKLSPAPAKTRGHAKPPLVTGRLVGDVTPVTAGASPLVYSVPSPSATAPPERRGGSASLLPAIAGAFAAILLFAGGVGRELRWRRGRRSMLPSGG
jgi:hypothetical protein